MASTGLLDLTFDGFSGLTDLSLTMMMASIRNCLEFDGFEFFDGFAFLDGFEFLDGFSTASSDLNLTILRVYLTTV